MSVKDRIYKSKSFGLHLDKQNFKTNYKRIMAEDCNEVIKKKSSYSSFTAVLIAVNDFGVV